MNSMEFNKIAAGLLSAALVFLLLNFFSGLIYGTREVAEHIIDEEHGPVLAYALPVEAGEGAGAAEEEVIDLHAVFAAADPAAGEGAFRACGACHAIEPGVNKVGPSLYDVVGRDIAAVEGFAYSDAIAALEGDWTAERLFYFLHDPRDYVPGTKMTFAGIDDAQANANVIAYLNQIGGSPVDLTEGLEPLPAATEGAAEDAEAAAEPVEGPGEAGAPPVTTPAAATMSTSSATVGQPIGTEVTDVDVVDVEEEDIEVGSTTPVEIVETGPAVGGDFGGGNTAVEPDETADQPVDLVEGDEVAAPAAGEPAVPAHAMLAGDAAAGERLFRRCQACHTLEEGQNRVGPHLAGVVGRDIAAVEGFAYSEALAAQEGAWTPEALSAFIADPKAAVPGTRMVFAGLKDEQDRIDLITFLQQAAP